MSNQNIEMPDGSIKNPVATEDFPDRPYVEAAREATDTFHQKTYVDPDHHLTGNMDTVPEDQAPESGVEHVEEDDSQSGSSFG